MPVLWVLLAAVSGSAQNAPQIGYVFPAGGQVGSTFQVVVGGRYLEPATNVVFSGAGIHATVVDFHKPMPQGKFTKLRDRMRELQDKRKTWSKASRQDNPSPLNSTNAWTPTDEEELAEIKREILKNPPNRNATPAIAEVATLRVTIDAAAAPEDREIRLGTAGALSNPLKFCVGQLAEISRPPAQSPNPEANRLFRQLGIATNVAPTTSEVQVTTRTIINGQIMPGLVDRYRFPARRGQRIVIAARARDLVPYIADAVPGWFQAALTLYDAKGREVSYEDDFRFHPDPVLQYKIPADGQYVLEVKDAIYRGREDFVYRITLGELPFLTGIYPLGGATGIVTQVELTGWNLPTNRTAFDACVASAGVHTLTVTDGDKVVGHAPFIVDALPDTSEIEPNNTANQAQQITRPVVINGRIAKPGDFDVFRFHGHAGESIVAEVMARRLDSPLDGVLLLTGAAGTEIAGNDDHEDRAFGLNTHHADPYLAVFLPADGDYFLRLGDVQGKGGPEFTYRLRISAPCPDFALRLVPSSINLRGGSSAAATVYALRHDGFTNEIMLALKNAPSGFSLSGGRIPAGAEKVKVTLKATTRPDDERYRLELEGHAIIGGQPVTRPVVPADDLMQAFFYRHLVPAQELQVSLAGRLGRRDNVKILSPTPIKIPVGGKAVLRLGFPRGPFTDRLHFVLNDAPTGISIENVALTKSGAELILQSDAAITAPGLKGNLIVHTMAARPGDTKPKAQNRDRLLGVLPAIPFECRPAPEAAPH